MIPRWTWGWPLLVILATAPALAAAPAAELDEFALLAADIAEAPKAWDLARLRAEARRVDALILPSDRTPVDVAYRRTRALLDHLTRMERGPDLAAEREELDRLGRLVEEQRELAAPAPEAEQRALFAQVVALRRRIAFRNPLLDFDRIVFVKRHRALFEHMCDQFYGIAAQPGGGVYELSWAFGPEPPVVRDVLAGSVVQKGRLAGQRLRGGTPGGLAYDGLGRLTDRRAARDGGAFLSLDLSFDGRELLFAYVECDGSELHRFPARPEEGQWDPRRSYHIFRARLDGSGLVQLTDGPANDFDPVFLPGGRIAFVSDRRGGYLRCDRVCPTYTMYSMAGDGSGLGRISFHETHEWNPSVDDDGRLVYTRWDYVDRDSDVAHHLWTCRPDGSDARSPHGNYPRRRELRPWMELGIRAIPGRPGRYVAVAAPHHGQAMGSLVLIDASRVDDHAMGQVQRLTPEVMLPESERAPGVPHAKGRHDPRAEVFGTPWPLDEDFCLASYAPGAHRGATRPAGIYLVDSFGNRELIYRDEAIRCVDPIPVKPRRTPPVLAQDGIRSSTSDVHPTGQLAILDVRDALRPFPAGTRIAAIRVVEVFDKTTPPADVPRIGVAAQSLARGVLGTAPVEADGSAFLTVPADVPIYFQALDERGLAVQTMRSLTYVRPGQTLTCAGCHERRESAPPAARQVPLALRRAPSALAPEAPGAYPLEFAKLVQPVLDRHCVDCHDRGVEGKRPAPPLRGDRAAKADWSASFESLRPFAWGMAGGNSVALKQRQYSVPGAEGALASKLYPLLASGHYDVKLPPEDLRRITLWLDCNSVYRGTYRAEDVRRPAPAAAAKVGQAFLPW